jgi:hypothetical protein
MTDKIKAERMADALDAGWCPVKSPRQMAEAAAELRRMSAVNAELLEALKRIELACTGTWVNKDWVVKECSAAIARATEE